MKCVAPTVRNYHDHCDCLPGKFNNFTCKSKKKKIIKKTTIEVLKRKSERHFYILAFKRVNHQRLRDEAVRYRFDTIRPNEKN